METYVRFATIARRTSEASWEQGGGEPGSGGIWAPLANLVRSAAAALADHLWHPYRKRFATRRALALLRERETELREAKSGRRLNWDPPPI